MFTYVHTHTYYTYVHTLERDIIMRVVRMYIRTYLYDVYLRVQGTHQLIEMVLRRGDDHYYYYYIIMIFTLIIIAIDGGIVIE